MADELVARQDRFVVRPKDASLGQSIRRLAAASRDWQMSWSSEAWLDEEGWLLAGVIVVGLGGNLGGPSAVRKRCQAALASLSQTWGPARVSAFLRTAPLGEVQAQPDFLNAVAAWRPKAVIAPLAALAALQDLEAAHGRTREIPGGARTLDLDLLLVGQEERSEDALVLPHPRMPQRAFVLQPLLELFGGALRIDASGRSVAECLRDAHVAAQTTQPDRR